MPTRKGLLTLKLENILFEIGETLDLAGPDEDLRWFRIRLEQIRSNTQSLMDTLSEQPREPT